MTQVSTNPETIRIPMMDGSQPRVPCLTFACRGVMFSARRVNDGLCFILHRATGLKVTAEYTGDLIEAIEGFADAVAVGAYDVAKIEASAATAARINA